MDLHSKILDACPLLNLGLVFFIFMQFLEILGQIIGWHPLFRIGTPLGNAKSVADILNRGSSVGTETLIELVPSPAHRQLVVSSITL